MPPTRPGHLTDLDGWGALPEDPGAYERRAEHVGTAALCPGVTLDLAALDR